MNMSTEMWSEHGIVHSPFLSKQVLELLWPCVATKTTRPDPHTHANIYSIGAVVSDCLAVKIYLFLMGKLLAMRWCGLS